MLRTRPECVDVQVPEVAETTVEELQRWAHRFAFAPAHVVVVSLPRSSVSVVFPDPAASHCGCTGDRAALSTLVSTAVHVLTPALLVIGVVTVFVETPTHETSGGALTAGLHCADSCLRDVVTRASGEMRTRYRCDPLVPSAGVLKVLEEHMRWHVCVRQTAELERAAALWNPTAAGG